MKKFLLVTTSCMIWNAHAQQQYYYAPLIQLADMNQPLEITGNDFGYVNKKNSIIDQGYYLWLDDQWYKIVNTQGLFHTSENGLAFYITNDTKQDLKIKDQLDVIYSYPIEALDRYKTSQHQYDELARVVIEVTEEPQNLIVGNEEVEPNTIEPIIEDTITYSPLLDIIEIEEEVITEVIPFEPVTNENGQSVAIENTTNETILNNNQTSETELEDIIQPAEIVQEEKNPYEKAVDAGFEGTVTEWLEHIEKKEGRSAYEIALDAGFEGSESDFMKYLWGSNVNPEIEKKERDTRYVMEWIDKIKKSDGTTPYELALRHGFYGTFTEWVESVIGADGEAIYNEDVKKGYKGTYKKWLEDKLALSNEELLRKELIRNQSFVVVPNMTLSVSEDADEVSTFSLYNYYQMFYGESVVSSGNSQSFTIKPEEIEYQVTWFNRNEITINSISPDGIIYYKKNPTYTGSTTNINVRYLLKVK